MAVQVPALVEGCEEQAQAGGNLNPLLLLLPALVEGCDEQAVADWTPRPLLLLLKLRWRWQMLGV